MRFPSKLIIQVVCLPRFNCWLNEMINPFIIATTILNLWQPRRCSFSLGDEKRVSQSVGRCCQRRFMMLQTFVLSCSAAFTSFPQMAFDTTLKVKVNNNLFSRLFSSFHFNFIYYLKQSPFSLKLFHPISGCHALQKQEEEEKNV